MQLPRIIKFELNIFNLTLLLNKENLLGLSREEHNFHAHALTEHETLNWILI